MASGGSGGPRTPRGREQIRKSQYKSGGSGSTPEWRTIFRKRCADRLKQGRERLVSRFRQMETESEPSTSSLQQGGEDMVTVSVREVMSQEWEHMRTENSELPLLRRRKRMSPFLDPGGLGTCKRQSYNPTYSSDEEYEQSEDVNYILSIIDNLTQELILEEQAMLAQCQERQVEMDLRHFEENSLHAAIDSLSTNESVICPICQKNFLLQDVSSIRCACGLEINTIHDGLSLDYLRHQLETCVTQHSTVCSGKPVFSLDHTLGIQNIIMNCSLCDFMYIVL